MAFPGGSGTLQHLKFWHWPLAGPRRILNVDGRQTHLSPDVKTRQRSTDRWPRRLSEVDAARHQAGHEDHQHDETHLNMVNDVEATSTRRDWGLAAPASPTPPHDRGHRPDLKDQNHGEEGDLPAGERRGQVERRPFSSLAFSKARRHAGADPQHGGDPPGGVGREEPAPSRLVERRGESPGPERTRWGRPTARASTCSADTTADSTVSVYPRLTAPEATHYSPEDATNTWQRPRRWGACLT